MRLTRRLIETCTAILGYVKSGRRIRPIPQAASGLVKVNLGCGLAVAKGWINVDGSLNALAASWPRAMHKMLYRATGANRFYTCDQYCSSLDGH